MSDYNRQLFLSRLAKKNVLSKNKFKHFYPIVTSINIQIDIDDKIEGNFKLSLKTSEKTWPLKGKNQIINNCNIKTGERIELIIDKPKPLINTDIGFNITLTSENEQKTETQKLSVSGQHHIKNENDKKLCSFIIPLLSPWSYYEVANIYGINITNTDVNIYPNKCRENWV